MIQWIYKLFLFTCSIVLFSTYYFIHLHDHIQDQTERINESLNISILTQTLTGLYTPPPNRPIKNGVMIQAVVGFLFMSGFILHLIKMI